MSEQHAYILSSHLDNDSQGCSVRLIGKCQSKVVELIITNQRPLFFIESSAKLPKWNIKCERKSINLKTFSGTEVDSLYFQNQSDLYQARDILAENKVRTFEADIYHTERFMMERFIKNAVYFIGGEHSVKDGIHRYVNPEIRKSDRAPKLSTASIDIETSGKDDLYSIGIHFKDGEVDKRHVFMVGSGKESDTLSFFPTEQAVYQTFEQYFHQLDPDIIIGWHIIGFDLSFLEKKCEQFGIPLNLGRGRTKCQIINRERGSSFVKLDGRVVIDGPTSLRACFYSFDDFKLDTVAHQVLGAKKDISLTSKAKIEEINRRFHQDKESLAKYNLLDCTLVTDIFEKLGLLDLMVERSLLSGTPLDKVGLSVASFDHIILPLVHRKGLVAPNAVDIQRLDQSTGGAVLESIAGFHEHVIVLDFESLYPSIIRTFKIDPYSRLMSHVEPLDTPADIKFSRKEHVLPDIIEEMMTRRKSAKEKTNRHLSQAIKILMNSFYGVMGSSSSRFYHADLPSAITKTGRWVLEETSDFLEQEGYSVLYGDTDSLFIKLKENEWTEPFEKGERLTVLINRHLKQMIKNKFSLASNLNIKFETYYRRFCLPLAGNSEVGAKKRYVGLTNDKDGGETLKFVGMEYVRSDWTQAAKEFQHNLFDKIFHDQEVEDYIRLFVNEIKSGKLNEKLIYKKRLVKDIGEYKKSIPPHIKAAIAAKNQGVDLGNSISYVITMRGPIPTDLKHDDIDYQHYIDRQIKPITNRVMSLKDTNFDNIVVGNQLSLL